MEIKTAGVSGLENSVLQVFILLLFKVFIFFYLLLILNGIY